MSYVRLPNGAYLEVPKGMSPLEALGQARDLFPKAFMTPEEISSRQGLMPALKEGFESAMISGKRGIGEMIGSESMVEAAKAAREQQAREMSYIPTTEEDVAAADKRGFFAGLGARAQQYVTEPVGSMVGRFAPSAAAAGAGLLAAPLVGPAGPAAGLLVGGSMAAAEFPLAVGETIERMEAQGQKPDVGRAVAFGIPQAALAGVGLPSAAVLPKAAQKIFGKAATDVVAGVKAGSLTREQAIGQLDSTLKNILTSTGGAAAVGAGTTVGIEALQRGATGEGLLTPEAMEAYREQAIAAGALAPFFGVPGGLARRRRQVKEVEGAVGERQKVTDEARRVEEEATAEAEALREAQARTGDLFGEQLRTEGPAKGKQAFGTQAGDVSPFVPGIEAQRATGRFYEEGAPATAEAPQFSRVELERKQNLLTSRIEEMQTQVAEAAQARQFDAMEALTPQIKTLQEELKATQKQIESAPAELPDFDTINKQFEKTVKEAQKAADLGDTDRVAQLVPKIRDLETKLNESKSLIESQQGDLVGQAQRQEVEGRAQVARELQEQTDLLKQAIKPEQINTQLDKYITSLQDEMEVARKNNADINIVNQLADRIVDAQTAKAQKFATTSDTVTQQALDVNQIRIGRITRAIEEAEAKQDTASVAGLRNRLAEALQETARPLPENRRNRALMDQSLAIEDFRSQIEDLKSKRFLGEGAKDMATAASLRSGVEKKALDAVGTYADAAVRDVNAVREMRNVMPLTNNEAIRLAMDVRGHLETALRNENMAALKEGTGNISPIEKQLAQIKAKYHKGPALKRRAEEGLRVQFKESMAEPNRQAAAARAAEELPLLREKLEAVKGQVSPDPRVVRQLEGEIDRVRKLAAEAPEAAREVAAKTESGVPEGQRSLFGEKDLEPIATTRATPQNFMKFLDSAAVQGMRAKIAAAERQFATLETKLSTKTPKLDQDFVAALEKQRAFVKDVQNADKIARNLRNNAQQLWQLRARFQKQFDAEKDPVKKDTLKQALGKLDETADARMREIDALHNKANELLEANLKTEQAILKGMEQKYARAQKASPAARKLQADMDKARAQIGQTEAAIQRQREERAKVERVTEQARLEAKEKLPGVRREVVETPFKTPGAEERVLRKKTTEVGPAAREERAAKAAELQREAAEQVASRTQKVRAKQSQIALQKQESKLTKSLEAVRKDIGAQQERAAALKSDKAKERAQQKIKGLLAREELLKTELADLKQQGASVERTLLRAGELPAREARTKPLRVGKIETVEQRLADYDDFLKKQKDKGDDLIDDYEGPTGTVFRVQPDDTKRVDPTEAKTVSDKLNKSLPKDVNFKAVASYDDLPPEIKRDLAANGVVEGSDNVNTVRGFVTPKGDIYVILNNHTDALDIQRTYVHELVGHAGVDRLLGPENMDKLAKKVAELPGGAFNLARELGIEADFRNAMNDMALNIAKMSKDGAPKAKIDAAMKQMEIDAVRELIAYTSEKRVSESLRQKLGRWFKELVGQFRSWLAKNDYDKLDKLKTSDIFNIIRQAQRNYNRRELGAFRDMNGNVVFRDKVVYNPEFDSRLRDLSSRVVAQQKPVADRIKASATGMSFMTRFVDRFAPLEYIAKTMKNSLEGAQMMYFNRLADQVNNLVAQVATNGSVMLSKNKDGTFTYKERGGPSLKNILEDVGKDAKRTGSAAASMQEFSLYMIAERAAGMKDGLKKLDLEGKFTQSDLDYVLKEGRANEAFQAARKKYREYNNGMLDLLQETGYLSKEKVAELKKGDYVPYYRERNGELIDPEYGFSVGNLTSQEYLRELVGGNSAILSFETSALQNTFLLTRMAMSNIATKNTSWTLRTLGIADIRDGDGPASPNIVRFYEDGKKKHAFIDTTGEASARMERNLESMRKAGKANTPEYKKIEKRMVEARASEGLFSGIPADLIVKGMEGATTALPAAVSLMRGPANLLRKAVTRNPAYAVRSIFRESLYGWIVTGSDVKPLVSAVKNVKDALGKEVPQTLKELRAQGITGGHVFAGTLDDMSAIALQISRGQSGWEKAMAKADRMAMLADEAGRMTLYNGFIKKGMTPMEATLATLESQNFTKHGLSPTMRAVSTMIPFFNAQVQGLNIFFRALTGKALFEDKLGVQAAMMKRGAMLAGATVLYSALMQDNEAYKNATDAERLNYWFIPTPFFDEPLRAPIPFEAGLLFKAIPEAMALIAGTDAKAKDVLPALAKQAANSIPGGTNLLLPQGVKPIFEVATNTNLFTMQGIESQRQLGQEAGYRTNANTLEVSKLIGQTLGVSPVQLDHLINGYTGATGVALLSLFNPILREGAAPDVKASQIALLGSLFQTTDGSGWINKAYNDVQEIERLAGTYRDFAQTDPDKADKYYDRNMRMLGLKSAAGLFKQQMGELNKQERAIRADTQLSGTEKRRELDELRKMKIEMAKEFRALQAE